MKIKKKNGESLGETLVSLIIISLALLMLPGAVVAAARVNAKTKQQVILMEKEKTADSYGTTVGNYDVMVTSGGKTLTIPSSKIDVIRFGEEENGLYGIRLK